MKTLYEYWRKFVGYMQRTWLIKLIAVAMILLSVLAVLWTSGDDITIVIFMLIIGVPAFFMDWKDEYLEREYEDEP